MRIATIGRSVSISSKSPRNAPKTMKIKATAQRSKNFLFLNLSIMRPTITLIPLLSFIAWNAPAITSKKIQSIIMLIPPSAPKSKNGDKMPFQIGIPPASSNVATPITFSPS